jgi:hypothetical protein
VATIEPFAGTFEGAGTWYDAAGKSAAYRIQQTASATDGGFEVTFRHDFDDGTVVEARFSMSWIASNLFRVDISGTPVGNGYLFGDLCHYHVKVGDKFVEVSYRSGGGGLAVFGSSSTNAEGNYIAWTETLRARTSGDGTC